MYRPWRREVERSSKSLVGNEEKKRIINRCNIIFIDILTCLDIGVEFLMKAAVIHCVLYYLQKYFYKNPIQQIDVGFRLPLLRVSAEL